MRRVSVPALFAAALAVASCQSSTDSGSSLTPTVVQPTLTTMTFSGNVDPNATSSNNFTTTQSGTISLTLTAAGPPPTITVGLVLGQPLSTDATQCVNAFGIAGTTTASTTPVVTTQPAPAGTYCIAIGEIGNPAAAIVYTGPDTRACGGSSRPTTHRSAE